MNRSGRLYIAGHSGLVGAALVRRCRALGFGNLLLPTHEELDLCDQAAVDRFFTDTRPDYVIVAAGRVGGIRANDSRPAEFLRDNVLIAAHVIDAAYRCGTRRLLYLGSSCIYPRMAPQPLKEEYLLTGALEPTNEWYALAKLAGLKMCQAYRRQFGFRAITALPANLYGPGDNYDLESSHVVAALIRKIFTAVQSGADEVSIWGSGTPRREFLHVDDLADACVFLLEHYDSEMPINVGTGLDGTILELAQLIARAVGYSGHFKCDHSQPDGTPRKVLDVSRLAALGWKPQTDLASGIEATCNWYRSQAVCAAGPAALRLGPVADPAFR